VKITNFRMVEYFVPEGTELPDKVRATLRSYIGMPVVNSRTGQRGTRYDIPIYLMQMWLERYKNGKTDDDFTH